MSGDVAEMDTRGRMRDRLWTRVEGIDPD